MPGKPKKKSPARQREEYAAVTVARTIAKAEKQIWPDWQRKVDHLGARDYEEIARGWLAHIPTIDPPGSPPREGIGAISAVSDVLPRVQVTGALVESLSGARPGVLHEAFYLAHKAVHVELSCAHAINKGAHTWAVVDAYQASLFALGSILAFLGLTVERHDNNFILVDVWHVDPSSRRYPPVFGGTKSHERYQFVRFKTLDHFHKWAILKRLLRTLSSSSRLAGLLKTALEVRDDKDFARHRNTVNYQSGGWLANDLLQYDPSGPVRPAQSMGALFEEISQGSISGTVYLMCALVELACEFARKLDSSQLIAQELVLLDRRSPALRTLSHFDWTDS